MATPTVPVTHDECPDLDAIALDLRLVASLLQAGNPQGVDLVTILSDLADACDVWSEAVSD